jgi:hypothetical protein
MDQNPVLWSLLHKIFSAVSIKLWDYFYGIISMGVQIPAEKENG